MAKSYYIKYYKSKVRVKAIWRAMISRCEVPNNNRYQMYAGRGIKVCERWKDFNNFWNDIGQYHSKGLTIDRIDNNGDYCPENCRLATPKEQANNTRRNRLFGFNGLKKTLTDWATTIGINRSTLAQRYYVYKWSIEDVLGKGVGFYGERV